MIVYHIEKTARGFDLDSVFLGISTDEDFAKDYIKRHNQILVEKAIADLSQPFSLEIQRKSGCKSPLDLAKREWLNRENNKRAKKNLPLFTESDLPPDEDFVKDRLDYEYTYAPCEALKEIPDDK